jgi:hypothetical protein
VVPRGGAVDASGANVVVVDETPRGTRLTVRNDVLFDFDRAELRPEAADALGRVKAMIEQRRPRAVRVVGHTDAIGSDEYNDQLSLRRAQREAVAGIPGHCPADHRRRPWRARAGRAERHRRARQPGRAPEEPARGDLP